MTSLNAAWTTGQVATGNPSPPASASTISNSAGAAVPAAQPHPAPPPPPPVAAAPLLSDATPLSPIDTMKAVAIALESFVQSSGRSLEFRVDNSSGLTVVTVRNSATGDLIRQIPSDEAVRIARSLGSGANALVDLEA